MRDVRHPARDLAGYEGFSATRAFVVKQDAVTGIHAIGLAVVHRDPIGVHLGHRIRAAGVEWGCLTLRDFLYEAIELGCRGLIELGLLFQSQKPDRIEHPQRANGPCCKSLTTKDSLRESMALDAVHEQAISRPLSHDELVQLQRVAQEAGVSADLGRQGHDLARSA